MEMNTGWIPSALLQLDINGKMEFYQSLPHLPYCHLSVILINMGGGSVALCSTLAIAVRMVNNSGKRVQHTGTPST